MEVQVRALSAAQSEAIRRVFPHPEVPRELPLLRGPRIEDFTDPGYKRKVAERDWDVECADVCVACGFASAPRAEDPESQARLRAAMEELRARLTVREIRRLWETMWELTDSAPPPAPERGVSLARSIIGALEYPRGSEAQARCLEEIAEEAKALLAGSTAAEQAPSSAAGGD
jgi:hypothetical protein